MVELKPCPFCSGEAYFFKMKPNGAFQLAGISCKSCGATPWAISTYVGWDDSQKLEAAARPWNRRPDDG